MSKRDDLVRIVRARGFRVTPQREVILDVVLASSGHITPQEVARKVRRRLPAVDVSTVYRTMALLEEIGILKHAHFEGGAEYHKVGEDEHVHLSCSGCGAQDDLSIQEAGRLRRLVRKHHGFWPDLTHFAISGLCADCQAASTAERGRR